MIAVTPELLIAATRCTSTAAAQFAAHLDAACQHYGINTEPRLAAFLAQLGHESGGLRHVLELASGEAYEGRANLGNTQPGDGVRYKGRGLIQVTGRSNYRAAAQRMRDLDAPDFEDFPEALEEPKWAAFSAADYWSANGLNALADAGDFDDISSLINTGRKGRLANGHADRVRRHQIAAVAIGSVAPRNDEKLDASPEPVQIPPEPMHVPTPTWTPQPGGEAGEPPAWPFPQENAPHRYPAGGELHPQEDQTMPAPIVGAIASVFKTALLEKAIEAIPRLARTYGSGSKVAERNLAAVDIVVDTVMGAVGARNEQEAIVKLQSDPAARMAAEQAIDKRWADIGPIEAGGGGVGGARSAVMGADPDSPVWRIVSVVTYAALAFLALANVIASTAWGLAIYSNVGIESATQFLSQVITADIGSAMVAFGFWLGSSWGSKQKAA